MSIVFVILVNITILDTTVCSNAYYGFGDFPKRSLSNTELALALSLALHTFS